LEGDQFLLINLTVSVAAVFYSEHQNGIAQFVEADTIITGTEAEFGWFDVLEALYVTLACGQILSGHRRG